MSFYLIWVIINTIFVFIDCLNEYFSEGEVTQKKSNIVLLVVLILAGSTGSVLLFGLFLINRYPDIAKLLDEDITLAKDDFWAGD